MLPLWGAGASGRKVLLAWIAGPKEDVETVRAFFQDLRARGPHHSSDRGVLPRSARRRCLAHRHAQPRHQSLGRSVAGVQGPRLNIVPNGFGERPPLELIFGALIHATERWRGLRFTESELHQLAALRKELDEGYEALMISPARSPQPRFSSKSTP